MRFRGLSASTRGHFTRKGLAKLPFDTRDEADAWGQRFGQTPYRCGFCDKWHVARPQP